MTTRAKRMLLVHGISRDFARRVHEYVGPMITRINELNATETDPSICHSHDYTDANVFMLEAMEFFGLEYDPSNQETTDICNDAWDLAKLNNFYVTK